LVNKTQTLYPDATVRNIDFSKFTWEEQLEIMSQTDVLIGLSGTMTMMSLFGVRGLSFILLAYFACGSPNIGNEEVITYRYLSSLWNYNFYYVTLEDMSWDQDVIHSIPLEEMTRVLACNGDSPFYWTYWASGNVNISFAKLEPFIHAAVENSRYIHDLNVNNEKDLEFFSVRKIPRIPLVYLGYNIIK